MYCHTNIVNRASTLNSSLDFIPNLRKIQPPTIKCYIHRHYYVVYFPSFHNFAMFKDNLQMASILLSKNHFIHSFDNDVSGRFFWS